VEELAGALERHRAHLESSGEGERRARERLRDEAADLVSEWARAQARQLLEDDPDLGRRLSDGRMPYATAEEILSRLGK
jgi:putative protein kinase ArgK-like GTPase of G3E family